MERLRHLLLVLGRVLHRQPPQQWVLHKHGVDLPLFPSLVDRVEELLVYLERDVGVSLVVNNNRHFWVSWVDPPGGGARHYCKIQCPSGN